jgi:hypothetical protein
MTPNHPIPPERIRAEAERVEPFTLADAKRYVVRSSPSFEQDIVDAVNDDRKRRASLVDVSAVQREAARKAWDARTAWGCETSVGESPEQARDRYLAREHPAPAPRECVHDLKAHPVPFAAVLDGRKTFEWRKDDRGYAEGDTLLLREWEPSTMEYTGREVRRTISYVLRAGFGVPDGYAVLAFAERAK